MGILTDVKAWYDFDNSQLLDDIGEHDLSQSGAGTPTYTTGIGGGKCVQFDTSNGNTFAFANGQDLNALRLLGQPYSISLWFNMDAAASGSENKLITAGYDDMYFRKLPSDRPRYKARGTILDSASQAMSSGTWYHLVLDQDPAAGEIRIYSSVHDVEISTSHTNGTTHRHNSLKFGDTTAWPVDSLLDQCIVKIGSNFTTADRAFLYNSGSGISFMDALDDHTGLSTYDVYWDLADVYDKRGQVWANLTNVGSATFTSGKIGNAVSLNGSSQYLKSGHGVLRRIGDEAFSMGCWINADTISADMGIMGQTDSSYSLKLLSSGKVRFLVETAGGTVTADSTSTLSTGTWYFVYAYHDPDTDEIGVVVNNGTADTASTSGDAPVSDDVMFTIGSIGTGNFFDGLIDQAFFRRGDVYSGTELTNFYNSGSGVEFSNELELDYFNSTTRKVFIPFPSSSVSGSSDIASLATMITQATLIDKVSEAIDADGTPWDKDSLRISSDSEGTNPIPLYVADWDLDNDPSNSEVELYTVPDSWDGVSGGGVYLWGINNSGKLLPPDEHVYGRYSVFSDFEFFATDGGVDNHQGYHAARITGNNNYYTPRTGKNGLTYDGIDDYIWAYVVNDPTAWTIGCWARSNSVAADCLIVRTGTSGTGSNNDTLLGIDPTSGNKPYAHVNDGSVQSVVGTTTLSNSTWYHFVAKGTNSGNLTLMLNGVSEGTPASFGTQSTTAAQFNFGQGGSSWGFWDGETDNLFIAYTEFTEDQIKTLYDNQLDDSSWWNAIYSPTDGDENGLGGFGIGSTPSITYTAQNPTWTSTLYEILVEEFSGNTSSGDETGVHASTVLTDNNTVTSDTGHVYALARSFTRGNSEYLSASGSGTDKFHFGTGDFAVEVWFKETSGLSAVMGVVKDVYSGGATGWRIAIHPGNGQLYCTLGNGSGGAKNTSPLVSMSTDTWHHVVLNFDRDGNLTPHFDNFAQTAVDISSYSAVDVSPDGNFEIGHMNGSEYMQGLIGPVRIYNSILDANARAFLYNGGVGRSYAELSQFDSTETYIQLLTPSATYTAQDATGSVGVYGEGETASITMSSQTPTFIGGAFSKTGTTASSECQPQDATSSFGATSKTVSTPSVTCFAQTATQTGGTPIGPPVTPGSTGSGLTLKRLTIEL